MSRDAGSPAVAAQHAVVRCTVIWVPSSDEATIVLVFWSRQASRLDLDVNRRAPAGTNPASRAGADNDVRPGHEVGPIELPDWTASQLVDWRGCGAVLVRLAYLAVTNGLAMLRLLPMSDRAKDVEILALRHQITVLQRQLHGQGHKVQFAPADRALLAALLHGLPRDVLHRVRLVVRPETVLRWHRDVIAARHARISRPTRVGRPRTVRSIHRLVLRLPRENSTWGYRRIHGELLALGIRVAASTVWEILKDACIDPVPQRSSQTWAAFLRTQAEAILAADFFETVTLTGKPTYVLAVIEHATRRVRILGATAHPNAAWVTQAVRNLAMDLQDAGSRARFLIRDRDGKYPALVDTILADTGINVVLSGVRMHRMNAIMERWIQTGRRELLDRTLIWNQAHLLHALRQYERHYNEHRPHRGISNSRPLQALPEPITDSNKITNLAVRRRDRLGGILHEYEHAA